MTIAMGAHDSIKAFFSKSELKLQAQGQSFTCLEALYLFVVDKAYPDVLMIIEFPANMWKTQGRSD